jgi:outer membrane protein OmpA-like peptidoglycan-associated protein
MKKGFLLIIALLLISGSIMALPSYTGLRGLNRTVDAKPIGAGEFSVGLFTFLGVSSDTRVVSLGGLTEDVSDSEYDATGTFTIGYGLGDKIELAGRVTYVWTSLKRGVFGDRVDLAGESETNSGISEAGLSMKFSTNPGEGNLWIGIMPWANYGLINSEDSPWVANGDEYDGIWQPGQPMFELRRPMLGTKLSAGADLLLSLDLEPVVLHANVGYHYFLQNFQFTDYRYGTTDSVEVDMDVEDPVFHLAMGIEYPMSSMTLFLEGEWRHFMKRDFEAGNDEDYDDMVIFQPGLRFPIGSGFAFDVVGAFSIDNFDPPWSDLGHHAFQAGNDPTNGHRAHFAPFPEGYYPQWGVGVNLMYSSDLVEGPTTAMLSGTVSDAMSGELLGATVAFPGSAVDAALSNAGTGYYSAVVSKGDVDIAVNAEGYVEATVSVQVSAGQDITRDFALQPTVIGTITDKDTGLFIDGIVSLGDFVEVTSSAGPNGMYSLAVPRGDQTLTASANGYLPSSASITVTGEEQMVVDFELESVVIEEGQVLSFDNIYFDVASATIKAESYPILDGVVEILAANHNAMIQIAGHTDSDGSESYNQTLSEQRASSVKTYLVNHGIDASRLSTVGFGESQPVVPNNSAANKALNRRIEFTVLSNR